ncbi:MAG TPA: right-handed parallel beta-helix repeat-containing protein [Natronosporangium sp.]
MAGRGRRRWVLAGGAVAAVVAVLGAVALLAGVASRSPSGTARPGPAAPSDAAPSAPATATAPVPGFPDASTTGVREGVTLRPSGTVEVTEDGAVVENLLIVDGFIEVNADDVTIRNVRITNDAQFIQWGIIQSEGHGGLVVEDSEIFGNRRSAQKFASGISNHGGDITVRRVEIHSVTDGIVTSHGLIEDCYLHSPRLFEGDHTDMIQSIGGSQLGLPLTIRHNTVINTENQTAAVFLSDGTGTGVVPVRNVRVEGNLLAGGGYTIYAGGLVAEGHDPADIVIRDNVFSRRVWPDGGYYGPVSDFDPGAPGNVWSGNVWEDGGAVGLD